MKKRKRLRDDNTQKCDNLLIQQDELEFTEKRNFCVIVAAPFAPPHYDDYDKASSFCLRQKSNDRFAANGLVPR